MSRDDVKILKIKMRGVRGAAKTEFLIALARFARSLGMTPALEGDGHNMSIESTKEQRLRLHALNHGRAKSDGPPRELLPDGDVA